MTLPVNSDMRNLYINLVKLINDSPVNIEAKRLIVSVIGYQIGEEADKTIMEEIKNSREENKNESGLV